MTTSPLSTQAIQEFKSIYEDEFGESISDAEAEHNALELLQLFDLLTRIKSDSETKQ